MSPLVNIMFIFVKYGRCIWKESSNITGLFAIILTYSNREFNERRLSSPHPRSINGYGCGKPLIYVVWLRASNELTWGSIYGNTVCFIETKRKTNVMHSSNFKSHHHTLSAVLYQCIAVVPFVNLWDASGLLYSHAQLKPYYTYCDRWCP